MVMDVVLLISVSIIVVALKTIFVGVYAVPRQDAVMVSVAMGCAVMKILLIVVQMEVVVALVNVAMTSSAVAL